MTKCSNRNLQKNIYYNNPTDGQETKSLGTEQGVRKSRGSGKPALKRSGVCEEEQGTPSQSTKSGTPPSLGGGMRGGGKGCTGRTSTAAAHEEFMPRSLPSRAPGLRSHSPSCYTDSRSCSPGQLCGARHHPCSDSRRRAKLGRGRGMCLACRGRI